MPTLLEQAKQFSPQARKKYVNSDLVELALSWLNSEVSTQQVSLAMNARGSNSLYRIALGLREAYRQGKIKIN